MVGGACGKGAPATTLLLLRCGTRRARALHTAQRAARREEKTALVHCYLVRQTPSGSTTAAPYCRQTPDPTRTLLAPPPPTPTLNTRARATATTTTMGPIEEDDQVRPLDWRRDSGASEADRSQHFGASEISRMERRANEERSNISLRNEASSPLRHILSNILPHLPCMVPKPPFRGHACPLNEANRQGCGRMSLPIDGDDRC